MREIIDENSKKEGRKRSRLPKFTEEEKISLRGKDSFIMNIRYFNDSNFSPSNKYVEILIKGAFDYFALNHYSTSLCTTGYVPDEKNKTFQKDMNVITSYDTEWPVSYAPWLRVNKCN